MSSMTERDDAPLPELQDQVIGWDVVDDLLGDIATSTRLFSMLIKSGAERMADGADLDLSRARAALDAGNAVQLRYLYQGAEWWDTLIPQPEGVRIVRVQQQE